MSGHLSGWELVEMHTGPDPPMTGSMHPQPMLWDRELGIQTEVVCSCILLQTDPPWEDATCGKSEQRYPGEETTPSE